MCVCNNETDTAGLNVKMSNWWLHECLRGESWGLMLDSGCTLLYDFSLPSSRWRVAATGTVKVKVGTGSDTAITTVGIKM